MNSIQYIDMFGEAIELKVSTVIIVLAIALFLVAGLYVLRGLGLYVMAKRNGIEKAYFSWIPFLWVYIAGKLAGSVMFFGRRYKNFALFAVIVCACSGIIQLFINVIQYIPFIGYYFQGGNLIISASEEFLFQGDIYMSTPFGYFCAPNMLFPYSSGFWGVMTILSYVQYVFSIAEIVVLIFIYIELFKAFLPTHYVIASIFSVLGLFGPFVFAVRKNKRFDYQDYIKNRYAAFYGVPPENIHIVNGDKIKKEEDPFSEFAEKNNDPFAEFSDKDDKDDK